MDYKEYKNMTSVFGHHILFEEEPQLNEAYDLPITAYDDQRYIRIYRSGKKKLQAPYVSEKVESQKRSFRYLSTVSFDQTEKKNIDWGIEVEGVLTLMWRHKTHSIEYIPHQAFTPERLRYWVYHTFLPQILELEGIYHILHVGSVEINEKALLFSAFSYGGKSTLTDYFVRRGHALLSDDTLGILQKASDYYAIPSYPFLRPFRKAETLGKRVENFKRKPLPITALFSLQKASPDAPVAVEKLIGIEKYKVLHYTPFAPFEFTKIQRFFYFAKMAESLPVYRLHIPWELSRLEEVYDTIMDLLTTSSKK
ncbi:hypothetical protein [Nitratifractor salsuginis]|uniref:HPr kinase n=1 Tax=Nitratifractor salsuginis (strain DSM 16511 / JCM 12458 / E9I37-1) TaxID=749222 RepID=E6X1U0_NITSE|nr:hypothetical protein [Nitratifractor salsuginis]ADV45948.1 hypothetical protein Nitsa_0680 [Nitratifractor salsuginis DSM 16511]